ncbi:MAG: ABC transporter ATP-binding protein [Firmicutes bacterium]|nr:ABC transporter ATP-binding protein [Bacillota bacterium]
MIKLEKINKIYKVGGEDFFALRDIDLEIPDGGYVSICGASGSGKTTLLNILGCLDEPSSGTYMMDDIDISKASSSKKARIRNEKVGFVLQDFALVNTQTVIYNVMLPLLYSKVPYHKIRGMAMNALEKVGLKDLAQKKANQLSGGQRQRVAIARAIVIEPSLILADEPTGQLDSATGMQIMQLLGSFNKNGTTLIVVTHDQKVAAMSDRIVTLSDGKVIQDSLKSDIL